MPVSAAQLAANRANARRSTGPRTAQGKTKVAANALKHGLLSEATMPGTVIHNATSPDEHLQFQALLAALIIDLAPTGTLETRLVQRLASLQIRLDRITRIESGTFTRGIDAALKFGEFSDSDVTALQESPNDRVLSAAYSLGAQSLNLLSYYEARLTRDVHRTLQQLQRLQTLRAAVAPSKEMPAASEAQTEIGQTNPIPPQHQHAAPLNFHVGDCPTGHPASHKLPQGSGPSPLSNRCVTLVAHDGVACMSPLPR